MVEFWSREPHGARHVLAHHSGSKVLCFRVAIIPAEEPLDFASSYDGKRVGVRGVQITFYLQVPVIAMMLQMRIQQQKPIMWAHVNKQAACFSFHSIRATPCRPCPWPPAISTLVQGGKHHVASMSIIFTYPYFCKSLETPPYGRQPQLSIKTHKP